MAAYSCYASYFLCTRNGFASVRIRLIGYLTERKDKWSSWDYYHSLSAWVGGECCLISESEIKRFAIGYLPEPT